jgi:hypothetical protein
MKNALALLSVLSLLTHDVVRCSGQSYSDQRVIVKFKPAPAFAPSSAGAVRTGFSTIDAITSRYNIRDAQAAFPVTGADQSLRKALGMDRVYVLSSPAIFDVASTVAELRNDINVEYASRITSGRGLALLPRIR